MNPPPMRSKADGVACCRCTFDDNTSTPGGGVQLARALSSEVVILHMLCARKRVFVVTWSERLSRLRIQHCSTLPPPRSALTRAGERPVLSGSVGITFYVNRDFPGGGASMSPNR